MRSVSLVFAPSTRGKIRRSFSRCSVVSALKKRVYGLATMCCGRKLNAAMSRNDAALNQLLVSLGASRSSDSLANVFINPLN